MKQVLLCIVLGTVRPCTILNATYVASPYEIASAMASNKWNNQYCEHYLAETWTRKSILNATAYVVQTKSCKRSFDIEFLSHFKKKIVCSNATFETSQFIEPLYAILRHPEAITCPGLGRAKKKKNLRHIITDDVSSEYVQSARQKVYFDLGASTYNSISQRWMLQNYETRGISFDRILLWEVTKQFDILNSVPPRFHKAYQFFNIPVTDAADDARNPLNIMRSIARPNDFVVFKLDIDSPSMEFSFISQILHSHDLPRLIDELYWEPQFAFKPMVDCCWGNRSSNMDISAIYEVFGKLRKLGIRAHGWP